MLVKKPEPATIRTNTPENNISKPAENKKEVKTTDYRKLLQMMLNDPDAITREEFLFLQSIIGYRQAAAIREKARVKKKQKKLEQTNAALKPLSLKKANSEPDQNTDGKMEASGSKNDDKKPLQMKKDEGNNSASGAEEQNNLRAGLEKLSGVDLSDVKVHRNSDKPQQVGALAYTQGNDIHIAPGQEEHLPHEGWHAVQQKQGIVKPTIKMKTGAPVNDDAGLEKEADVMGAKAAVAGKGITSAGTDNGWTKNSKADDNKGAGNFVIQKKNEVTETKPKVSESELEELQLKGMTDFKATSKIDQYLKDNTTGAKIKVKYGNFARGTVQIKKVGQSYSMVPQAISLLKHPFSNQSSIVKTSQPCLVLSINGGKLMGFMSLWNGTKVPAANDLAMKLVSDPGMFGLQGIALDKSIQLVNSINSGRLELGIRNATVKVGGAFNGRISFGFEPDSGKVSFSGSADVNIKGLVNGSLTLERTSQGSITGNAQLGVNLTKNLSGAVNVKVDEQGVSGEGGIGYAGEKLSGKVTLRICDKNNLQADGTAPKAGTKPVKSQKPQYVLSGEGNLAFQFTDWLSGTADCLVDENGNVTISGKIIPQKELTLFEQKDYIKPLFNLEARASYGIPVVGNIFLFASIGLEAFAKLGPAKLYNIVAEGTYSTDPQKCNDFSISASLNISAAAGVKLIGKAGAGLEVLGHDVKAGASITAIAGLAAYADATPVIGYKENAQNGQDKKGQFFISGVLEIAAQPFFGLEGDIFVEVVSPWWSPLGNKEWKWPLFNKSYPLGGQFGIMAKVQHVLGSKQLPEIEFGKVDFSADKFMTDLMNDKAGGKKSEVKQPGKWNEQNSKSAQPPKNTGAASGAKNGGGKSTPASASKASNSKAMTSSSPQRADRNAKTSDGKTVGQHQNNTLNNGGKGSVNGKGSNNGVNKNNDNSKQLAIGLTELKRLNTKYDKDGATREDLVEEVNTIKAKNSALKSVSIIDGKQDWDFKYGSKPEEVIDGPKKGDKILSPKAKFKIGSENHELWVERTPPKNKDNVVMAASNPSNIEKNKPIWGKLDEDAKNKVFKLKQPKNKKFTLKQVDEAAKAVEKCLWKSPRVRFKLGSESHELWVERGKSKNVVMMASEGKNVRRNDIVNKALSNNKKLENGIGRLENSKEAATEESLDILAGLITGVSGVDKGKRVSKKRFFDRARIRARQIGNVKHSLYKLERRQYYEYVDRYEEVGDHTFEVAIRYTQGPKKGEVVHLERTKNDITKTTYGKPDEVDYINNIIIDVKASTANEADLNEIRSFYEKLYIEATGVKPQVIFKFYDRNLSGLK
jgi:hypothetical protein